MDMHALINFINVRYNTRVILHEKYATGENQGAYALSDDTGVGHVLKWNDRPTWLRSLRRAEQITNHLAKRGVLVPKYVLADTRPDNVTYWIQTALPGLPPEELRVTHVEQLLDLVEQQARQTLRTGWQTGQNMSVQLCLLDIQVGRIHLPGTVTQRVRFWRG